MGFTPKENLFSLRADIFTQLGGNQRGRTTQNGEPQVEAPRPAPEGVRGPLFKKNCYFLGEIVVII